MASTETTNGSGAEEQPTSSTPTSMNDESPVKSPTAHLKEESSKLGCNNLIQGKRHLVVKDFPSAIESLGEACRHFSESETLDTKPRSFDNVEAHFFYGKALLEQSRIELGVLEGPDLNKTENASDDSEDEKSEGEDEEEEDEDEADATNEASKSEEEPSESSEADANGISEESKDEGKPSASVVPQESAVTSTDEAGKVNNIHEQDVDLNAPSPTVTSGGLVTDNEVPSTSSGLTADAAAEKQAEEELSNLELAWEVLEVAKLGYRGLLKEIAENRASEEKTEDEKKKLAEKDKLLKKRLADTHCSLGEVATESENYNQAIDEFKTGLEILNEIEGSDSREIAQYYFQMGLAYSFDKKFPDAIASFRKSVEIIENRISILKMKVENKQTAKDLGIELEEGSKTEAEEIQELTALLPELQEKITDTIDAERESQALEEEEQKEQEIILRNSPVKNPNPPAAKDISHLVKKKKKAEDDATNEPPLKKVCTEIAATPVTVTTSDASSVKDAGAESSNGSGAANGHPIAIDA